MIATAMSKFYTGHPNCNTIQLALVCNIKDCGITSHNYAINFYIKQYKFDNFDGILTYGWWWSSSLQKGHVNRNNFPIGLQASLDQVELRGTIPSDDFNTLQKILHSRVIIKLGPMSRNPNGLDFQPPRTPLCIECPVIVIRRSQPCVFISEYNVEMNYKISL